MAQVRQYKMKILRSFLLWSFGLICGAVLLIIYRFYHSPLAEVTIKNESSFILTKVIIHDEKLANNYLIENLRQKDSSILQLYASGEIGFKIISVFENGDTVLTSGYAESGYRDLYIIKNDSIIYKHKSNY